MRVSVHCAGVFGAVPSGTVRWVRAPFCRVSRWRLPSSVRARSTVRESSQARGPSTRTAMESISISVVSAITIPWLAASSRTVPGPSRSSTAAIR